ncbi:endo alpha-1,4 polygalactosaminidase [Yinghuangia seranimata]|uniref:endo alpha-1,4 polygalactosaminidase n=1 Tax=Yinghuangia seranimata TaxID=408067 RepID=UPI00248BAAA1|nr:endo alpha-1,4 polygalactosaminidase [Yinghuangia seranimata]MDI2129858.1 endo alpha-1,4 polygalactosaminidase [Yinghuangia seranimata]
MPPGGPAAPAPNAPPPPAGSGGKVVPPTANAGFDYQIGGPYQPAAGVQVVSRDHAAPPLPGAYNICYVNAFQAQPDATGWWEKEHPDLLLRNGSSLVIDEAWNEAVLDVSTDAKRKALMGVVGPWIDDCARKGFQAVEPDNLDSYTRSQGKLTMAHDVEFAKLLAARAHAVGLAIGQKNAAEMTGQHGAIGFDFAVAEECGKYDECGTYANAYANRVFVVEYTKSDFDKACAGWSAKLSIVLRDREVTPTGKSGHQFAVC